jgi:ParB-like chromosome segregation protein Spo0J
MAKRKRLTPARIEPLPEASPDQGLETKALFQSYPDGFVDNAPRRSHAPISEVARAQSAEAALQEVSTALQDAREQGRMVLALPLGSIDAGHLVRDRIAVDEDEMQALRDSLMRRGQQTPIEVIALPGERYGLISGWRRMMALRALDEGDDSGKFDTVLALLRRPDDSAQAYQAMVEENEIRVGLSFYERARIVAKAVEQGVYTDDQSALRDLFAAAPRARRSKIKSFLTIVAALDGSLRFPEALSERAGLALTKALMQDAALGPRIQAALARNIPATAEAEQAMISGCMAPAPKPKKQSLKGALDSDSAPPVTSVEPADGITLSTRPNGEITLAGVRVDAVFRDALITWLALRG